MCLIGKTQLLCMQCRGIGPHLVARGKSHGFSRVAAGTCDFFKKEKDWSEPHILQDTVKNQFIQLLGTSFDHVD